MDYHRDRFEDHSLMIFKNEALVALLPTHLLNKSLVSHNGLTYGGLIVDNNFDQSDIKLLFDSVFSYCKLNGFKQLILKTMPNFYQNKSQEKIEGYLKQICEAKLDKKRVLAIDYSQPLTIHKTKLKHFRKHQATDFIIKKENTFKLFWNKVLIPLLKEKHNTKPVHSLGEIELLNSQFPKEIVQYNVYCQDKILAGITIFDKGNIVKSQYGAATKLGKKTRALEYLFLNLIFKFKQEEKTFFSMGTVIDKSFPEGYNTGLYKQKKELGCSDYTQNCYNLPIV